jgi:hypothetical protein
VLVLLVSASPNYTGPLAGIFDSGTSALLPIVGEWGTNAAAVLVWSIPTFFPALWLFHVLTGRIRRRSQELHCRRCDYILRGLSEPRCPECGEAI